LQVEKRAHRVGRVSAFEQCRYKLGVARKKSFAQSLFELCDFVPGPALLARALRDVVCGRRRTERYLAAGVACAADCLLLQAFIADQPGSGARRVAPWSRAGRAEGRPLKLRWRFERRSRRRGQENLQRASRQRCDQIGIQRRCRNVCVRTGRWRRRAWQRGLSRIGSADPQVFAQPRE
jgi:hypothetical protein